MAKLGPKEQKRPNDNSRLNQAHDKVDDSVKARVNVRCVSIEKQS